MENYKDSVSSIYERHFAPNVLISRGKLIHRHRFGVQMIAQMNLFRGQMIDHQKQFGGETITLMTVSYTHLTLPTNREV